MYYEHRSCHSKKHKTQFGILTLHFGENQVKSNRPPHIYIKLLNSLPHNHPISYDSRYPQAIQNDRFIIQLSVADFKSKLSTINELTRLELHPDR